MAWEGRGQWDVLGAGGWAVLGLRNGRAVQSGVELGYGGAMAGNGLGSAGDMVSGVAWASACRWGWGWPILHLRLEPVRSCSVLQQGTAEVSI